MFKLLKDLTRAPEPLSAPPREQREQDEREPRSPLSPGAPAAPRLNTHSPHLQPGHGQLASPLYAAHPNTKYSLPPPETPEPETDPHALEILRLLQGLKDVSGTMAYVETLSHMLMVPSTPASRRAFRRNDGFQRLLDVLRGLAWTARPEAIAEDEWTVFEVQRAEGLRLWFEVLAWAMGDRAGQTAFERLGGYMSLLPLLQQLHAPKEDAWPDHEVMGLLLAHILGNNYTLRTVYAEPVVGAEKKLKEVTLRWPRGLPLVWQYLWGMPRNKEKAKLSEQDEKDGRTPPDLYGLLEAEAPPAVMLTLRVLLTIAQSSRANLVLVCQYLPQLPDFLLTRVYGFEPERHYDVTFPPRDEWYQNAHADAKPVAPEWTPPAPRWRKLYLALLETLLTAGITPRTTWWLFQLVRKVPPKAVTTAEPDSIASSGAATPVGRPSSPTGTPSSSTKKKPTLKLKVPSTPLGEKLDDEVLRLIQCAMRSHNPHAFAFRSAPHVEEGGLEIDELGRPFPNSTKGFLFSCWVNIAQLNDAVVLLHLSQPGRKHPLLQIRILENSQVGITSTAYSDKETGEAPVEVVCGAPDALVPHCEWVHFAVGCRKGRSAYGGGGEARIFINGQRVGAVRVTYPVPRPGQREPHQHGHFRAPPSEGVRVSVGRAWPGMGDKKGDTSLHAENQWMLGRTLLLEEVISEDLVLLMHHLGPRYYGNFQEALGKFLTYEDATTINLHLHSLATAAQQQAMALLPANSALVRAITTGPAIVEDNIMLSLAAKDVLTEPGEDVMVLNGAVPHASRARDFKYGRARVVGNIFGYSVDDMDTTVSTVGGAVAVLKMIDLASDTQQLTATLNVLVDMLTYSWSASEEMERIHGYDLLAAILRPKMATMMDETCATMLLDFLGVDMTDPDSARVICSAGYKALCLDFELWAHAPLPVLKVFLQNFDYLLDKSRFRRFNLLRTFQKSNLVRRILYAVRSGFFEPAAIPFVVDTLRLALTTRWSAEDAIKPIFSYLVSALCQNTAPSYLITTADPTPSQYPAALTLKMMVDLMGANAKRLIKLNRAISLHRLLVIFLQSNPAPFVVGPCLDILALCISTPGLEAFQRHFEGEGGFALLARTLAPVWDDHIQATVFSMLFGPAGPAAANLACPPAINSIMAALDTLLQAASNGGGMEDSPMARSVGSIGSLSLTPVSPAGAGDGNDDETAGDDDDDVRLENLLSTLAQVYRQSSALRRALTVRRIETMLPAMVDFVTLSAPSQTERADARRTAAADWLQALVDLSKAPATIITQLRLLIEQLKAANTGTDRTPTGSFTGSAPLQRKLSGGLSSSVTSLTKLSQSPSSSLPGSPLRRRPSQDANGPIARLRAGSGNTLPRPSLRRTLTGESILNEERDKNAAWRMIILSTDAQSHSAMTKDRKEHWKRLNESEWPRQVAALRAENGVWADQDDEPVAWRLDGSEGPLRMRVRLERVEETHAAAGGKARNSRARDVIPSTDQLSSAVSRINDAPWEDPFALALGEATIEEEAGADQSGLSSTSATPQTPTEGGSGAAGTSTPASQAQSQAQASAPTATPAPPPADDSDSASIIDPDDDSSNLRLVAKALQAGDTVDTAHNIVRIVGVDALPGLLILGRRNLYLIDGLVQTPDGQVVEAEHAPKDVLSIPSGTLADLDKGDQRSHRWPYTDIVETNKRAFLFRDVALELYFADKQNFLVVFRDKRERQTVVNKMGAKSGAAPRGVLNSFVLDALSRALVDTREAQLESMTRKWQNREISNFAYIQMLNQHANRTPNDVTQYPVFPWVLADYTSQTLDLTRKATYRDLSKPMGALTQARRDAAVERYQATEGVGETPFHYGTHYSSSMIVCGYMIRVSPFTEIFLALQGGTFDLADRLFSSIPRAWDSASNTNRGDVRELIPEFFYAPSFLLNINHHDFGKKQVSGDSVDDVVLPPWALNDPLLFVHMNREALETDYVSRHLPEWIDLTFGYKQRDPESYNCFHPLSYRGAVDLDKMKDESEKAASTAIIHNFGQTPLRIFKEPHPYRMLGSRTSLPVGQRFGVAEHWQLLLRSIMPVMDVPQRVHHILDPPGDGAGKPRVEQKHRLAVPGHQHLSVQYGFADQSVRVYAQDTGQRLVHIVEGIDVVHAAFASPTLLVTVSSLGVITAWRLGIKSGGHRRGDATLTREATLRGHDRPVTCIAVSMAWSFLVTGCDDGTAFVWDMNRLRYTRALKTPRPEAINLIGINEASGHIALASARYLYMYSLNGHAIAATSVDGGRFPEIRFLDSNRSRDNERFTGGITFLQREFIRWGDVLAVGVGSSIALYRCVPGVRRFEDQDVEPWRLVKQGTLHRSDDHGHGDVSALRFIRETLYAAYAPCPGGRSYAVYQWSLPDGTQRHVPESIPGCMAVGCGRNFGLLEPRRYCAGCGGAFCGSHALHVEHFDHRFCDACRAQLAHANSIGIIGSRASRAPSTSVSVSVSAAASRAGSRSASRAGSRSASRPQSPDPGARRDRHGSRDGRPTERARSQSRATPASASAGRGSRTESPAPAPVRTGSASAASPSPAPVESAPAPHPTILTTTDGQGGPAPHTPSAPVAASDVVVASPLEMTGEGVPQSQDGANDVAELKSDAHANA